MKKLIILAIVLVGVLWLSKFVLADCADEGNCSVVGLQFLGQDQNLNHDNYKDVLVFRDQVDAFFVNGNHINLDTFKNLGINADYVGRGKTVDILTATKGI